MRLQSKQTKLVKTHLPNQKFTLKTKVEDELESDDREQIKTCQNAAATKTQIAI
jgi:hypothetical protein